jgi:hypothetical protein
MTPYGPEAAPGTPPVVGEGKLTAVDKGKVLVAAALGVRVGKLMVEVGRMGVGTMVVGVESNGVVEGIEIEVGRGACAPR